MPDTATWGGLEIQLVSEEVVQGLDAIRSVLTLLNQALDLALQVGNIVRTFVTSNLDPVRALTNQLIQQLRNLIQDLFGLGLYANVSDLERIRRGINRLSGGYPAFERRMLTALNDRNDPNRPDFTPSSTVIALFFYVGVDVSFTNDVVDTTKFAPIQQFLRSFTALFGLNVSGSNTTLPRAVNLRPEYASPTNTGSPDFSIALSSLLGRDRVRLIWNSAPAQGGSTQDPVPQVPPTGFIVEVSCYRSGFQAAWIAPAPSGTGTGEANNQSFVTGRYQQSVSGQPLVIFGGDDAIKLNPDVQWPAGYTPGTSTLPAGAHPVYFFRDASTPEVIRKPFGKGPEEIEGGRDVTRYFNQRRFFVPKNNILQQAVSGGNYSLDLDLGLLPFYCPIKSDGTIDTSRAQRPQSVYVRVIPVSDQITEANYKSARWVPRAHVSDDTTTVHIDPVTITGSPTGAGSSRTASVTLSDADLGTPSEVVEVLVPDENQNLFGLALQTAIAIVLLSRSDLTRPNQVTQNAPNPRDTTYRPTGLEAIAVEVFRNAGITNADNYFARRNISPQSFTGDLYQKIVRLADQYINTQGALPPATLRALQSTMQDLVNWKWSDTPTSIANGNTALRYTILQSLNPSNYTTPPLAMNRYNTRKYWAGTPRTPDSILLQTATRFSTGTFGALEHATAVDSAPVVGPSNNADPQYWFARDLIPAEIYAKARAVLAITSDQSALQRSPTSSWLSTRVFAPRAPTGTALTVLNRVEGFLNVSLSGLQNVTDGINRVIDFLEQRVREVQELLKRIETYLDIPFNISFPSAKALFLITNGTEGIVTGLVSSQQKPQEGDQGYGGGGVLIAGSAPSILVDLLSRAITSGTGTP